MSTLTDYFDRCIASAKSGRMSDTDIAGLAEALAGSGDRLAFSSNSADLASTGGPGSLSTLWGPAALAAAGRTVPKLGVPGRPAGGVDVLAQVPGYRVDLDRPSTEDVLARCGYVHVKAGAAFAPADAEMFRYRQQSGAQAIPSLAIASLLSKKLAMGVHRVGLEARVGPHGNFGEGMVEARENARRFVRVAELLGMRAVALLIEATFPRQPYLGRGEALVALAHLIEGVPGAWLEGHAAECERWSTIVSGSLPPTRDATTAAFLANIVAQGGSPDALKVRAAEVTASHSQTVKASEDGVVGYDLGVLRSAIMMARAPDEGSCFDDSAGAILLVRPGDPVREGEPLVSLRCPGAKARQLARAVASAIGYSKIVARPQDGALEVIGV